MSILENRPILIVVSGAPGSGKSTLAKELSERLNFLHIERDILLEQIYQQNKHDPKFDQARVGVPKAYELVATILKRKISIVMDATLYKNISEKDIKKLGKNAKLLNIHCEAGDKNFSIKRFRKREINLNNGIKPDWLDGHMQTLDKMYDDVVHPLDLGCPVLVVDSVNQYNPPITEIMSWIKSYST